MIGLLVVTIVIVSILANPMLAIAQSISDTEETNRIIDNAEVTFVVCDTKPELTSDVAYYNELECDHNISFLKGQCENSNNTAYNWCYNADMERYLNGRGLKDAPRPPDTWCNMNIVGCIAKWEAMKDTVIESSEVFGTSESEATTNLLDSLDDTIQELEDKKEEADQGGEDDTDNDDND